MDDALPPISQTSPQAVRRHGRDLPGRMARRISRAIGKAIGDFQLIADGDRILVALSGGKDSLTLLHMLAWRRRFAPVDYELLAVHVQSDMRCGSCSHRDTLQGLCDGLQVPLLIKPAAIRATSKGPLNCYWCSTVRRSVLFAAARELGFCKIALGHHLDDIAETTLLNLFFHGNFSSMIPCQPLFNGEVTLIRPLAYVAEADIIRFAGEEAHLPTQLCRCPFGDLSQRKRMKKLIADMQSECPAIRQNILRSMSHIREDYLVKP